MSAIEQISLLTASPNIQYIAFGIFTIVFGIVCAIAYMDQFKDIRIQIENWSTSIFGSRKNNYANESASESANESASEIDSDQANKTEDEQSNMQETLSPF